MINKYVLLISLLLSTNIGAQVGNLSPELLQLEDLNLQTKKQAIETDIKSSRKEIGLPAQELGSGLPPIYFQSNPYINNPLFNNLPKYNATSNPNFVELTNQGVTLPRLNLNQANTPPTNFIQGPSYPNQNASNPLPTYGNSKTYTIWPNSNPYNTPKNPQLGY